MARQWVSHTTHRHRYKTLSDDQEFHLMTIVLDKFLWLGLAFIGIGLYFMIARVNIFEGLPYVFSGLAVMIVFVFVIVRFFERYTP